MTKRNRVTLITGAAGGIGQALCRAFLDAGDIVVGIDRSAQKLTTLTSLFENAHFDGQVGDVTDLAAMRKLADHSAERYGAIDIVVANAGGVAAEFAGDMFDTWRQDIDLNLNGAAYTVEAARPYIEKTGGGSIVLIGSVNGLTYAGHPAYSAAKAALVGHTRSLACLLGPKNIRVNLLAPGTVRTPAWDERQKNNAGLMDSLTRWYPLGRICEPEDIASVAVFLASDAARMVHGIVLPVDGGLTAGNFVLASEIS